MRESLWESFKEYIPATARWWWVVVTGFILTATGAILDSQTAEDMFIPIWGWVAISLVGLFIAQFIAFCTVRKQREALQQQIDGLLETPMIDFGGFTVKPLLHRDNPSLANIDVALQFDNISPARLRYEVESLSVEIVGKTASNPTFDNRGGIILPTRQGTFLYPMISDVDISNSPLLGSIEYTIKYVTIPEMRKFRQRRKLALHIYPPKDPASGGNWYVRYTYLETPDDEVVS